MITMAGGLKNLIALADTFASKFTSKEVQNTMAIKDLTEFAGNKSNDDTLKSVGITEGLKPLQEVLAAINDPAMTESGIKKLRDDISQLGIRGVEEANKLSAKSDSYSTPEALAATEKAFNYSQELTKTEQTLVDALNAHPQFWKFDKSTTTEDASAQAVKAGASATLFDTWAGGALKNYLAANSQAVSEGIAELSALNKPTDEATYNKNKAAESAIAKPVEAVALGTLQTAVNSVDTLLNNALNRAKIDQATLALRSSTGANTQTSRDTEISNLATEAEQNSKRLYFAALDLKKFTDDAKSSMEKVFDLLHTAAEVSVANLQRGITKLSDEATQTEITNGHLQKRIDLLKQEFAAVQFSAYDKKLAELKTGIASIGADDSTKAVATLSAGIKDLRDNFVEVKDATGNIINPLQNLIDLLIDTQVATSLNEASNSMKTFKKSISDWLVGMNVSNLGNAETQMKAAQTDFDTKYNVVTDKSGKYSNAEKSEAMSGITGSADKLIAAIHKWGANGDDARAKIEGSGGIMERMKALANEDIASLNVMTFDILSESNGYLKTIADNSAANDAAFKPANETPLTAKDIATELAAIQEKSVKIEPVIPTSGLIEEAANQPTFDIPTVTDIAPPVVETKPVVETAPVVETKPPVVETAPIVDTAPPLSGDALIHVNDEANAQTYSSVPPVQAIQPVQPFFKAWTPPVQVNTQPLEPTPLQQAVANDVKYQTPAMSGIGMQPYAADANVVFSNGIYDMKYFAGGGISNEPAIFGEAGWEAAVPLPDGRTIPVTIKHIPPAPLQRGESNSNR
jgi:hypothetical protein